MSASKSTASCRLGNLQSYNRLIVYKASARSLKFANSQQFTNLSLKDKCSSNVRLYACRTSCRHQDAYSCTSVHLPKPPQPLKQLCECSTCLYVFSIDCTLSLRRHFNPHDDVQLCCTTEHFNLCFKAQSCVTRIQLSMLLSCLCKFHVLPPACLSHQLLGVQSPAQIGSSV